MRGKKGVNWRAEGKNRQNAKKVSADVCDKRCTEKEKNRRSACKQVRQIANTARDAHVGGVTCKSLLCTTTDIDIDDRQSHTMCSWIKLKKIILYTLYINNFFF